MKRIILSNKIITLNNEIFGVIFMLGEGQCDINGAISEKDAKNC
jgi:hypothetical protein